jgi:hypothetical protein
MFRRAQSSEGSANDRDSAQHRRKARGGRIGSKSTTTFMVSFLRGSRPVLILFLLLFFFLFVHSLLFALFLVFFAAFVSHAISFGPL